MFTIHMNFHAGDMLQKMGLQDNGPIQKYFTRVVAAYSDKYVPFDNGVLATVNIEPDALVYDQDYARVHWYGKVMVYPESGKLPKEVARPLRPMHYQGAPIRGPHWVTRSWIDNKEKILESTAEQIAEEKNK